MPLFDGTGPAGKGRGMSTGRMGGGRGMRRGKKTGSGAGGNCICPACGAKVPHQQGIPCNSVACSKCGAKMVRE
ncbi:MAG: hypothetical protein V1752_02005 [Candidatus Firestonebacteria bacterium]